MISPMYHNQEIHQDSQSNNNNNDTTTTNNNNNNNVPITSMPDSLSQSSPSEALLHLSLRSEKNALRLAQELIFSLNNNNHNNKSNKDNENIESKAKNQLRRNNSNHNHGNNNTNGNNENNNNKQCYYPIDVPPILSTIHQQNYNTQHNHNNNNNSHSNPIITAKACTESIQHSLTKVASGGSAASSTLRNLESERRAADNATNDVKNALTLRHLSNVATDALSARKYDDAVKAISDFDKVNATQRAKVIAGPHAIRATERTKDVLSRTVLERYEEGVNNGDLRELSNLTPLLGMLGMADKGVGLYLKFAQENLSLIMNKGLDENDVSEVTVCTKLAKIYNAAVTFLRHHLPMVAFSLGEAEGDVALVQLIHAEVEKRAIDMIRQYILMKTLAKTHMKSNGVAEMIEEKYISGDGLQYDEQELYDGGKADGKSDKKTILDSLDDCGFKTELGSFVQVNASLDELALLLQHTESYERFIRHAVDEVNKARKLRKQQKLEERKKKWMQELESQGKDITIEESNKFDEEEKEMEKNKREQDVLSKQTQLNDIIGEAGGYYCGLERTFLLASLQRTFQSAILGDERTYAAITILPPNRSSNSVGSKALQTSLVEESLYAAQRSTLRAFATGHSGTASAASNFCADILGRFLLEVLIHRADVGTAKMKPGDGLLPGQGGLGQAALAVMTSAQKGLTKATDNAAERIYIQEGIAMACANLNDLEVAVDYTGRLEQKLLDEMKSTFPSGKKETEQLCVCIKSLTGVKDSLLSASNEAIDHFINTIMPRVRSIVSESVGQDSATSSGFMVGTTTTPAHTVRMNYHLDNDAYELAQLSEGYMSRL